MSEPLRDDGVSRATPEPNADALTRKRQTLPAPRLRRRKRARWRFFIGTIVCLLLGAGVGAWFFVVPVHLPAYAAQTGTITVKLTGPGILDATRKVTVTSRVPGFLNEVLVDRNDVVKSGQLLARLEATDIRNQLGASKADAAAATSAVAEANGDKARLEATADRARRDYDRRRALIASSAVSQVDLETAETTMKQAIADQQRNTATIARLSAQAESAGAQVKVLQAKLADSEFHSPYDGVVISRERNVGDLLTVGASLMQLVDPRSIIVSTRLDESAIGLLQPGQHAAISFSSDPRSSIDGSVLRVGKSVDIETREFLLDVLPAQLPPNWAIGQRATVVINTQSHKGAMTIPQALIARRDGKVGAWCARNGRAVWVPIDIGLFTGDYVEVYGGIDPGDRLLPPQGRYGGEAVVVESATR